MSTRTPATTEAPTREVAVEIHRPAGVAAAITGTSALDDFDDLDMSPEESTVPLLHINRKVGQDESGVLVGDRHVLELDFVWAARATTRAAFPARYDADPNGRPDCWSADGTMPAPQIAEPRSKACAGCPWSFEATGGKEGPDGRPGCSKNLEALVYLDDGAAARVARMRFGGLAYKAARAYWESFKFSRPKKMSVQFMTHMTLVSVKTDNGNFLVPEFARAAQLSDEEAIAIASDARSMLGSFRTLVADDIVSAEARDTDTQPGPFDEPASQKRADSDGVIYDEPPFHYTPATDRQGTPVDEEVF